MYCTLFNSRASEARELCVLGLQLRLGLDLVLKRRVHDINLKFEFEIVSRLIDRPSPKGTNQQTLLQHINTQIRFEPDAYDCMRKPVDESRNPPRS